MVRYSLIVRDGSRSSRAGADSLDELFALVERHVDEISRGASGKSVRSPLRDYEPVEQVAGRIEISRRRERGFGRERAGIDVRGDGSMEAFVGRANRRLIEQLPGESAVGALRREFAPADEATRSSNKIASDE